MRSGDISIDPKRSNGAMSFESALSRARSADDVLRNYSSLPIRVLCLFKTGELSRLGLEI